jgi:hypothetical protein
MRPGVASGATGFDGDTRSTLVREQAEEGPSQGLPVRSGDQILKSNLARRVALYTDETTLRMFALRNIALRRYV